MDIFVGAEVVIAKVLIALSRRGEDRVSFRQLGNIGWNIQQRCNANGVDAIILTSGKELKAAVYDFSDYFEYENIEEPMIRIKKSVPITDLEKRFVFCIPSDVEKVIDQETDSFLKTA